MIFLTNLENNKWNFINFSTPTINGLYKTWRENHLKKKKKRYTYPERVCDEK